MCHIKIHSKIITIFLSLKIKISDHLRRKTMEPKDRIRLIYEKELKMSQRSFAKSIGIAPTGLSGIFRSGVRVTRLMANSIELKYGYRADWILEGKDPKMVDKLARLDPFDKMVLDSLKGNQSLEFKKKIILIIFQYKYTANEFLFFKKDDEIIWDSLRIYSENDFEESYKKLFRQRKSLLNELQELEYNELIWVLMTVHTGDELTAHKCEILKGYRFPDEMPASLRSKIDDINKVQCQIEKLITDKKEG